MGVEWRQADENIHLFKRYDRKSGELKFRKTRVDLIFDTMMGPVCGRGLRQRRFRRKIHP
ncbi:hypothetical protein GACE_0457 [Geoglobus acetivorans]|uniref:Uncharacterized protein n=1 Tax=Geoglobus acetivorans TaxID=565033 RepID=A0A0A7GBT8_GEOAI|nr:hypothetical protein GACE_0457 [Geoglobus acetivorans]